MSTETTISSNLYDYFNPHDYIYLNPELEYYSNIDTVEKSLRYYTTYGSNNSNLYSIIDVPSDFYYKIYLFNYEDKILSSSYSLIDSNLSSYLYSSNPERLAIIDYVRNRGSNTEYNVSSSFVPNIYKTFTGRTNEYLNPSEYYLDYITAKESNVGTDSYFNSNVQGTPQDFVDALMHTVGALTNFQNTVTFASNIIVKSSIYVSSNLYTGSNIYASNNLYVSSNLYAGISYIENNYISSNLEVGNYAYFDSNVYIYGSLNVPTLTLTNLYASNIDVDVFTINNHTQNNTYINDDVIFHSNLIVTGSSSKFSNNTTVEYLNVNKDLNVSNIAIFSNNIYSFGQSNTLCNLTNLDTLNVNKLSYFRNDVNIDKNLYVSGLSNTISNLLNIDYLNVNKKSFFNDTVTISNNLYLQGSSNTFSNNVSIQYLNVNNTATINDTLTVYNNAYFGKDLNISGDVYAQDYITNSDARVKHSFNLISKERARNTVMNLVVKDFNIYDDSHKHVGLVAQDVEKIDKDFIRTTCKKYDIKKFACSVNSENSKVNAYIIGLNDKTPLNVGDLLTISCYKMEDLISKSIELLKLGNMSNLNQNTINPNKGDINYDEKIIVYISKTGLANQFELCNLETKLPFNAELIYIHYKTIEDFKSINYMELFNLNFVCIQDIYEKLDKLLL